MWEILGGKGITVTEDSGPKQHGLKLPDVSGPVIGGQQRERSIGDAKVSQSGLFADPGEKMARQCGDVAGPFTQRGQDRRNMRKRFV